ncbi:PDDEXK family nuclease [Collimonas humicola]|uniref:hypothetical protein n=1 Tax=Collimonas humicola TaxID=2825886 RepID=UPI001B8ACAA1|nr:hypothetical protein [Collimonas humicola]
MALYEIAGESLIPITQRTFTELGLQERANIQKAVRTHIAAITPGVKTMVLAEEFGDWVGANRRIDLLCLDEEARLVVVELKREDGAHMELQALRYAAMVSTMRFEQAVEAHRKYLKSIGSMENPEQVVREFLEREEGPVALSETVRIVLAASDFPQELTTAVLWLNKQGLDLRCVQMRPHLVDQRILVDIQQVIPLPEAEQYQVAVREKSMEQAAERATERDRTRYDLSIGDLALTNLPKRRLIYEIVAEALRRGVSPSQIVAAVPWKEGTMFVSSDGQLDEQEFQVACGGKSLTRYFTAGQDLFHVDGKTYAFSTQWGLRTLAAIGNIISLMPEGATVNYLPTTEVVDEVSYGEHVIRQRENGTIEIEWHGVPVQPVKPVLRDLALKLNLGQQNGRGNDLNTRQLGAQVIRAVRSL